MMQTIDTGALIYRLTELIRVSTGEYKHGLEAARLLTMQMIEQGGKPEDEAVKPEHHKSVIKSFGSDGFNDEITIEMYSCGNCKKVIERREYQFCPWCGKAVKWK